MFSKKEIVRLYNEISESWNLNLKSYGVKLPNLKTGDKYNKGSLVLIFLYSKIGCKVSKQELTEFLKLMGS